MNHEKDEQSFFMKLDKQNSRTFEEQILKN